jgi:hypothetical protein
MKVCETGFLSWSFWIKIGITVKTKKRISLNIWDYVQQEEALIETETTKKKSNKDKYQK